MIELKYLPVSPLRITSKFGKRDTGIKGASTFHMGIDLGQNFSKKETNVIAVDNGVVVYNNWNDYRGWYIIIDHGEYKTLYQHLKRQSVHKKGYKIQAGQIIGIMGNSSNPTKLKTATHLHFELIKRDDTRIDPEPYLKEVIDMSKTEVIALIQEVLKGSGSEPSTALKLELEEAKRKGITDGNRPQGYAKREEVAAMILRAIKK